MHFTRFSSSDAWTLIYSENYSDYWSSQSFVSSNPIGIVLTEGEQVALSVGWDETSMAYSYDPSYISSAPFQIGDLLGGVTNNNFDTNNPTIDSITPTIYYQTIATTLLD